MIAIIDYGVGNLFSLESSFASIGADVVVTGSADVIKEADKIILPGVGAFEDAAKKLRQSGLDRILIEEASKGKLILGICLGMQLLFEKSMEYGEHPGLGLLKGTVVPIADVVHSNLKIPHMGWNVLHYRGTKHPLFRYLGEQPYVYFVHSYFAADCDDSVIADTDYEAVLTAAVASKNVMGCQFHPEKSGETGLSILKAFVEMKEEDVC